MTTDRPARVLLTGGIGSGKSAVGALFAAWGAVVVDADHLAREVVAAGTPGLDAVRAAFGDGVMAGDGTLDRAALADVVFHDAERLVALEQILHPLVQAAADARFAAVPQASVHVYEVPVPWGEPQRWGDHVVVVDAPDEVRRARLLARGLEAPQVSARMAAQPPRPRWLAIADHVVDNSGDRAHLEAEARRVWRLVTGDGPGPRAVVGPAD